MDEADRKTMQEEAKHYEDKYQPIIDDLMKELRILQGKYNRLNNKYEKLKNDTSKKKKKGKQHFRNQTGAQKGVRR